MRPPPPPPIEWDARSRRLSLPSDPRCLREARRIIEEQARRLGYRQEEVHDIAIAVHEAVMNAMVHGNRGIPSKRVEVRLEEVGEFWVIRVRDEGEGFDGERLVQEASQETAPESGRGLRIIAQLMDRVTFSTAEREVALWKRRPSAG